MNIEQRHGMTYITVGDARYQIAEDGPNGLMIRLAERFGLGGEQMSMSASAGNTFHVRPTHND